MLLIGADDKVGLRLLTTRYASLTAPALNAPAIAVFEMVNEMFVGWPVGVVQADKLAVEWELLNGAVV